MSEINLENIVSCIVNDGYFIIKNYYSIEQCNNILNDIKNIPQNSINYGEGKDIRIAHFENYSKGAQNFLNDNFLLQIGNNILGHEADRVKKRCQLGILKYHQGNESSGGGWHVDNHNPQFKALLYLTNVNLNNGPFAIISPPLTSKDYKSVSSEKDIRDTRFPDKIEEDYKDNVKYLTGNMGDVIVVNTQNIHRGTTIKQGERISLTNYYYDGN
uniref:Fe2OG dioxygenase domain-containing protein n=1 Tax=viral metagenome TaxID=1070528 RepID=A0A6C0KJV4_9ZZZZ